MQIFITTIYVLVGSLSALCLVACTAFTVWSGIRND
jgi:hypothetical protein